MEGQVYYTYSPVQVHIEVTASILQIHMHSDLWYPPLTPLWRAHSVGWMSPPACHWHKDIRLKYTRTCLCTSHYYLIFVFMYFPDYTYCHVTSRGISCYAWGYMHYQCHSTLLLFLSYCPNLIQLSPRTTSLKESRYLCARAYAAFIYFLSFHFFSFSLVYLFFYFLFSLFHSVFFSIFSVSFVFYFLPFTMDSSGLTPAWLSFGVLVGFGAVSCTVSHVLSLSHAHTSRATSKTSVSTRPLYSASLSILFHSL